MQTQEEIHLINAIQQGDKDSFNHLFNKYYPMLCAYSARFVCIEDAEEVVQDIMVWFWENREMHCIEKSLSAYLFKIVYNRTLNRIVKNEAMQRADTFFYSQMQELCTDCDFYQIKELTQRIEEAIKSLPPSYLEAFKMHRFEHMSYKEIAEILKISHKTVDYRIQQALKILRKELKDYLPILIIFLHKLPREF